MIVIKIELHSARNGQVTELGRAHIANDGTSADPKLCSYDGQVLRKPRFDQVTRHGRVVDHRRQDETVWHLLGKMLKNMGYVK